jgi:hypothetical protein
MGSPRRNPGDFLQDQMFKASRGVMHNNDQPEEDSQGSDGEQASHKLSKKASFNALSPNEEFGLSIIEENYHGEKRDTQTSGVRPFDQLQITKLNFDIYQSNSNRDIGDGEPIVSGL